MNDYFLALFVFAIVSAIGGLIIKYSANKFVKLSKVKFWNSFLVCLIACIINIPIIYFTNGLSDFIFAISTIITISLSNIFVGKLVWKCNWNESYRANSIWLAIISVFLILSALGSLNSYH